MAGTEYRGSEIKDVDQFLNAASDLKATAKRKLASTLDTDTT